MSKEFNWDEFEKALHGSSNICAGARKDIERAIQAGKGFSLPSRGQVWQFSETGSLRLICLDGSAVSLCNVAHHYNEEYVQRYVSRGEWKFVAESLAEYLAANGGVL